jgi:hypothetical protein
MHVTTPTLLVRLETSAAEAEQLAERRRKMVEMARELGDDGIRELMALIDADEPLTAEQNGNGHPKPGPTIPRGREAVRQIVRERPGRWTLGQLRDEMVARGWFTTAKGLEAAAKRLCDIDGEGRWLGRGQYVFPADHGKEGAIESDRSDAAMIASR